MVFTNFIRYFFYDCNHNNEKQNKVYINSHAAFWNDQDGHGGEVNAEQEYGLRIDCVFTDKFRKKLGIDKLSEY